MSANGTLDMTVDNIGFMLDRLGEDCAPLQFLRELTQNSIEAIQKTPLSAGEIIWDVDWTRYTLEKVYKLAIIDTGVGMTGPEMVHYINQLSASMHGQSMRGNFGVGAKIAAATRNHAGLIYLSWKDGVGSMIHLWRDPTTGSYGLVQIPRPDGTFDHWAHVTDDVKPKPIAEHGTMVVLLGNDVDADTMQAPPEALRPSRWIARYLNTRYFKVPDGIAVRAREGWDLPRGDANHPMLRSVTGQKAYLDEHSAAYGTVELTGAAAHWWVLKDEPALQNMLNVYESKGHAAALYQDELYEMMTGRAGVARLQLFGVIFGHHRVVIYAEPHNAVAEHLSSNTARTQLLVNREPLPWAEWAAEFRSRLPDAIVGLMEATGGASTTDHRQAIKDRLKQIRDMLRISRYRPTSRGSLTIAEDALTKGGQQDEVPGVHRAEGTSRSGTRGGRAGDIYSLFLASDGLLGEEVHPDPDPDVDWISVLDETRIPPDLEDRAAKFLPASNRLLINADFRVFSDMIKRYIERYSDISGAEPVITEVVREWFEQALIETVLGAQALRGARHWSIDDMDALLSEQALTAAVMPRYHIDIAIKRALGARLGSVKDRAS